MGIDVFGNTSSVVCSVAVKRGIAAVAIQVGGTLMAKKVYRVDESRFTTVQAKLMSAVTKGLLVAKTVMERVGSDSLVIECNNSVLCSWIEKGYATDDYDDLFAELQRVLHSIPARFKVSCAAQPKALMFASEKYLTKSVISKSLDDLLEEEEAN